MKKPGLSDHSIRKGVLIEDNAFIASKILIIMVPR